MRTIQSNLESKVGHFFANFDVHHFFGGKMIPIDGGNSNMFHKQSRVFGGR